MVGEDTCCPLCGCELDVQNADSLLPVGTILASDELHAYGSRSYWVGEAMRSYVAGPIYLARDLTEDVIVEVHEYFPPSFALERDANGSVLVCDELREAFEEDRARFLDEARALRTCEGMAGDALAAVARVRECFEANGTAYAVAEHVKGYTLNTLLTTQARFEPAMFLRRVLPLARSLEQLHGVGFVYGHVTPHNVVWSPEGELCLMGFGGWEAVKGDASAYAAPELSDVRSATSGMAPGAAPNAVPKMAPSVDVYGLCATLYFGLTGVEPIPASERLRTTDEGLPDPLVSLGAQGVVLQPVVERALTRGLALSTDERQQSMEELIAPLARSLAETERARKRLEQRGTSMLRNRCAWCMSLMEGSQTCPQCGRRLDMYHPAAHHLPLGTLLQDRYLVGASLGEGGFGITYIGFDVTLERTVALKEYFPSGLAARRAEESLEVVELRGVPTGSIERGSARFLEEARVLARPGAGSSAAVALDYFAANGTAYIVMEYVGGVALREYVREHGGKVSLGELLDLLVPMFNALRELHEEGFVHHDVSPENIVVGDGVARLVDFGLARGCEGESAALQTEFKHGYTPPEQYAGGGSGMWTDVYALSATIYECLTGRVPPDSLDRLVGEPMALPHELGADAFAEKPCEHKLVSVAILDAVARGEAKQIVELRLVEFECERNLEDILAIGRAVAVPHPVFEASCERLLVGACAANDVKANEAFDEVVVRIHRLERFGKGAGRDAGIAQIACCHVRRHSTVEYGGGRHAWGGAGAPWEHNLHCENSLAVCSLL